LDFYFDISQTGDNPVTMYDFTVIIKNNHRDSQDFKTLVNRSLSKIP